MQVTYGKGFEPSNLIQSIDALQAEMVKHPQYEPPTEHVFHGGMYCRQVWRPAGCLIVGKVHKKEHFYMIVSGTVTVTTDDGVQTITANREPSVRCTPKQMRSA
jgi:hypothetical protein